MDHHGRATHQHALSDGTLTGVGEEQHVDHDDAGNEEEGEPHGQRDDSLCSVDTATLLAPAGRSGPSSGRRPTARSRSVV